MFTYQKKILTKMDLSRNKGIFVGYCEVSKAFRIYITRLHHMEISRDVTFDEEVAVKRSESASMKKYMKNMHFPKI